MSGVILPVTPLPLWRLQGHLCFFPLKWLSWSWCVINDFGGNDVCNCQLTYVSCAYLCRWRDPWRGLYCVVFYWCWPKSDPWNRSSCLSCRINTREPAVCVTLTACSVDLLLWWVTISRWLRLFDWWVLVLQIHVTRKKYFWNDHFFCTNQL